MGMQTDDHRLILYRDGQEPRDITQFIGDLTATDELNALSVELTFSQIISPWDKYVPKINLSPGDKVRVNNKGNDIFSGVIVKVGLDGSVTAYDRGWYLNKSSIVFQCNKTAADTAVKQMCEKAGITAGEIISLPTKITQSWVGKTPAEILSDILNACSAETGKDYHYRVISDTLEIKELTEDVLIAYHKPAENVAFFNITWALGQVSGEDSIEELKNSVIIAAEDDGKVYIGAESSNASSISKFGKLQHVETVSEDPGDAKLRQMAKNLLSKYDRVDKTRTIEEIWGADEVVSGVVLSFNSPAFGVFGKQRVKRVTHHYGGAGHTMSLELQALVAERSVDDKDSVTVYGLPDDLGNKSETTSGSADSTGTSSTSASSGAQKFLEVARSQIGYKEQGSNRTKYGQWFGMNGVAWCAIFVSWCAAQSGAPITKNASVSGLRSYFQGKGLYKTGNYIPKPGDIMIQKNSVSHTGIVESATASYVKTIEGNCSNSVRRMTRKYSEISGFGTPWG